MFGRKELSIAAAAALAACSPQAEKEPQKAVDTEQVSRGGSTDNVSAYANTPELKAVEALTVESGRVSDNFDKALAEKYNVSPEQ